MSDDFAASRVFFLFFPSSMAPRVTHNGKRINYELQLQPAQGFSPNVHANAPSADKLMTHLPCVVSDMIRYTRRARQFLNHRDACTVRNGENSCRLTSHEGHAYNIRGLRLRLLHVCLRERFCLRSARCGRPLNRARSAEDRNA